MKTSFVYLMFFCFTLIATSAEIKPIHHENCKIEIYSNFIKLKDINGKPVEYKLDTIKAIKSLFVSKGYTPVAGFYPGVMSLDINSFLRQEEQERVIDYNGIEPEPFRGDFETETWYCWNVTATIKGDSPLYQKRYATCKNSRSPELYMETIYDYDSKILRNAIYTGSHYYNTLDDEEMDINPAYTTHADRGYQFTGGPVANAMEEVLLGPSAETIKEYKDIPNDSGILKNIPYCCTPQDLTSQCVASRENRKN